MSWPTFPDGVLVGAQDLQAEVEDRLTQDRQRLVDTADTGVASGLVASVNSINGLLVDLTAGRGYTPSGEQVVLESSLTGLALSDYTAGTLNLVCVQYSTDDQWPGTHVSDGSTPRRRRTRVATPVVLTAAEYDALITETRQRTLVCGVVTAQGPAAALSASDLSLPEAVDRLVVVTQPALPGLRVVGIDPDTTAGTAELDLNLAGANPAVSYTEPDDTTAGSPVAATGADDIETIVCTGATAGYTIDVELTKSLLPTSGAQNATFAVEVAYEVRTRAAGGHDHQHRGQQGTGVASPGNPHAARTEDLSGVGRFRQLITTPGGSSFPSARYAEAAQRGSHFSTVQTRTCIDQLRPISGVGGSPIRLYVTNTGALEFTSNAYWDETAGTWNKDRSGVAAIRMRIGTAADLDDPIFTAPGGFAVDTKKPSENAAWSDGVGSSSTWTRQAFRLIGETGIADSVAYLDRLSLAQDLIAGGLGQFGGSISSTGGSVSANIDLIAGGDVDAGGDVNAGGVVTVDGAMPGTPAANTLYRDFLPVAYCEVDAGPGGTVLSNQKNIASGTITDAVNGLMEFTFNAPLALPYMVTFTSRSSECFRLTTQTLTTGFEVRAWNMADETVIDLSSTTVSYRFLVFGRVA